VTGYVNTTGGTSRSVCEESDIPRIGSGGPAGTADQTERVRKVVLLKETRERRATDEVSMLGYRMYNSGNDGFYVYVLLLILLRRLDPRDSAWESQPTIYARDYQQLSFG